MSVPDLFETTESHAVAFAPEQRAAFEAHQQGLRHLRTFQILGTQARDFLALSTGSTFDLKDVVLPFDEFSLTIDLPIWKTVGNEQGVRFQVRVRNLICRRTEDGAVISIIQDVGPKGVVPAFSQATLSYDREVLFRFVDLSNIYGGLRPTETVLGGVALRVFFGFLYVLDHRKVRIVSTPVFLNRQQRREAERQGLPTGERYKIYIPATLSVDDLERDLKSGDKRALRQIRGHDRRAHFRRDRYGRKRIRVKSAHVKGGHSQDCPYPIYKAENVGMEGLEPNLEIDNA